MTRSARVGIVVLALVAIAVAVAACVLRRGRRTPDTTRIELPIAVPDKLSLLTVELRGNDRLHVYFGLMKENQYVAVDEAVLAVTVGLPESTNAPIARSERTITVADFHREPMDGTKFESSRWTLPSHIR